MRHGGTDGYVGGERQHTPSVSQNAASTTSLVPYGEVCQGIGTSDQYGNNSIACATLNTEIVLPHSGKVLGGPGTNVASAHFPAACNA